MCCIAAIRARPARRGKLSAYNLIVCTVPHNGGEIVTTAARLAGSPGGTVLMARGFSRSTLLQLLSLGEKWLDVVLVLVPIEHCKKICDAIIYAARKTHRKFGSMFTVNNAEAFLGGGFSKAEEEMATDYKLITVISNKGYADDIMAAARAAGASGGTVVNARGTAKPGDAKFLGMDIVPEKDMLFVLAPLEKALPIQDAIKTLPCLSKPGSGIVFSMGASNFTLLGK